MEHPFFTSAAMARSDALRWLEIAEKLLEARNLFGSKSFAERARNADPSLSDADQILAVVDTLLGAERRFVNNLPDWFAVLHLTPLEGLDAGVVSDQFRRLRYLLDPQTNRHPFAEQAFRLIYEAYSNLINPTRRSLYDTQLGLYSQPPPPPQQLQQLLPDPFNAPIPALPHNFILFGGGGVAQQLVHGGQSGGVGGSNSAQVQQVHVQPKVEPVDGGSTLQPQNFMGFSSGHNIVFGSGSTSSKSGHETVSNHEQENYSNFGVGGNVVSASETTQELFNNIQNQSLHNFSNVSDETIHNVNVTENFGTMEGKEDVEVVDDHVAEEEEQEKEEEKEEDKEEEKEEDKEEEKVEEKEEEKVVEKEEEKEEEKGEERANSPVVGDGSTFWTACPYCYNMYEYPQEYVDCALKCQNCKRAFQAVVISSPPQVEEKEEEKEEEKGEERANSPVVGDGSTFWTACPYCYYMYEYPQEYVDCALKCQNCKRAFQAVVISSPPPIVEGQESYYCCWGVLPFGFSMEEWKKHNAGASGWAPFTPMFSSTQMGNNVNEGVDGARGSSPKVNVDNNENYVVISDSCESDKDGQGVRSKYEKNKAKNVKGKKAAGTHGRRAKKARAANIQDGIVSPQGAELPKKLTSELNKMGLVANAGKQPGCTKLDLNVELSIETEEPAIRTHQSCRGEDDNIEGNGFFEGLDEFLSSLPILDGVGDNKVVKAEN